MTWKHCTAWLLAFSAVTGTADAQSGETLSKQKTVE